MRTIRIGLLGLGTVGQAVVQLNRPFGDMQFEFTRALVAHPLRPRSVQVAMTQDPAEILDDPAIDVVVEAAGGRDEPRQWIRRALENGKAVATANKEVMAYHGPELLAASQEWDTYLGYEASVGGGIPILDALGWHLSASDIFEVTGVLNGTTNYLLTAMAAGQPFDDALSAAQKAGFAEADPSADLEGADAVRKLVLLTHLAFGEWLNPDAIPVTGLTPWPPALFARLQAVGLRLRLLGTAQRRKDGRVAASVAPTVVPSSHPAFRLEQAQNGVAVTSQAGRFFMEGPGAGGPPTATSIWADIRRSQRVLHPILPQTADQHHGPVPAPERLTVAITHDPDRPLKGGRPLGPGIALFDEPLPASDGLWHFPYAD